mgnify:CR=1 FL=1|jgi:cytidine deaminase
MTGLSDLDTQAKTALLTAYAPYSHLRVGAAVRTRSGATYRGCNVECASYTLGGCAERAAIAAAVQAEGPGVEILEVAIYARNARDEEQIIPPCGGCRQMIMELGPNARVRFLGEGGMRVDLPITDLLPHAFALVVQG